RTVRPGASGRATCSPPAAAYCFLALVGTPAPPRSFAGGQTRCYPRDASELRRYRGNFVRGSGGDGADFLPGRYSPPALASRWLRAPPAAAATRGSRTRNVVPAPAWLSAAMLPPWASTIWRAMARPRPAPALRAARRSEEH